MWATLTLSLLIFLAIVLIGGYLVHKITFAWELKRRKLDLKILREELSGVPREETTLDQIIAEHGGRK